MIYYQINNKKKIFADRKYKNSDDISQKRG